MLESRRYLRRHRVDWALGAAVVLIAALGLVNLRSATIAARPSLYAQQIDWIAVGLCVFAAAAAIDYRRLLSLAYPLYAAGVLSLVVVLIAGKTVNGARRWLDFGPVSVQPSEFMKLLLILAIARFMHDRAQFRQRTVAEVAIPAAMAIVPMALILRQPDLGTAFILFLLFCSTIILTRVRLRSLVPIGLAAALAAPLTWTLLLQDYQRQRILTFLDPGHDLSGAGWHARQALIAVGSGGPWGKGWMRGTQTQLGFLPERWTDFPFAVWAEEWGLAGAVVLVTLYFFLIAWGVHLASQARERYGQVLCAGIAAMLFWHVVINLGMVLGLLPVVGVWLPLFSYGGSSVLTALAATGLLMSVSLRRHTL